MASARRVLQSRRHRRTDSALSRGLGSIQSVVPLGGSGRQLVRSGPRSVLYLDILHRRRPVERSGWRTSPRYGTSPGPRAAPCSWPLVTKAPEGSLRPICGGGHRHLEVVVSPQSSQDRGQEKQAEHDRHRPVDEGHPRPPPGVGSPPAPVSGCCLEEQSSDADSDGGGSRTDPVGPHEGPDNAGQDEHHVDVEQVRQGDLAEADLVRLLGLGQEGRDSARVSPPRPLKAPRIGHRSSVPAQRRRAQRRRRRAKR